MNPTPAPVITIKPRLTYEVLVDGKTIGQGPVVGEWEGMLKIKVGRGDIIVSRMATDAALFMDGLLNPGKPETVQVVKATPAVAQAIGEAHAEAFPEATAPATADPAVAA